MDEYAQVDRRFWTVSRKRALQGLLFISPWFIGFMAFSLIPTLYSFYYSCSNFNLLAPAEWVGAQNYRDLLNDPVFWLSVKNTAIFLVFGNVITLGFGLLTAVGLAANPRGRYFMNTTIYLPALMVPVAFGLMMRPIFATMDAGLLNQFMALFKVPAQSWLEDPRLVIWTVVMTNFWFMGYVMVIYLAGLKNINRDYYEAAMLDGAGPVKSFRHITLPLLAPITVFQLVMGLIGALQLFDIPIALTGFDVGGLASMGRHNVLASLVYYVYVKGFKFWQFGSACAIAWVVFGVGLVLSVVVLHLSRKYSFYGDQL